MKMSTPTMIVIAVVKKTKAVLFKDFKIGTMFRCEIEIESPGRSRNGTYASYVTTTNLHTGESTFNTFTALSNLLECFEYEEDLDFKP